MTSVSEMFAGALIVHPFNSVGVAYYFLPAIGAFAVVFDGGADFAIIE